MNPSFYCIPSPEVLQREEQHEGAAPGWSSDRMWGQGCGASAPAPIFVQGLGAKPKEKVLSPCVFWRSLILRTSD